MESSCIIRLASNHAFPFIEPPATQKLSSVDQSVADAAEIGIKDSKWIISDLLNIIPTSNEWDQKSSLANGQIIQKITKDLENGTWNHNLRDWMNQNFPYMKRLEEKSPWQLWQQLIGSY